MWGISFARLLALLMVITLHVIPEFDNMSENIWIIVLQSGVAIYVVISAVLMANQNIMMHWG